MDLWQRISKQHISSHHWTSLASLTLRCTRLVFNWILLRNFLVHTISRTPSNYICSIHLTGTSLESDSCSHCGPKSVQGRASGSPATGMRAGYGSLADEESAVSVDAPSTRTHSTNNVLIPSVDYVAPNHAAKSVQPLSNFGYFSRGLAVQIHLRFASRSLHRFGGTVSSL
ncbi:hypothetical protein BDQ17DRAFT_748070 [Cyathus striatus]|nr:hypothetical protein BDQ17DRAFT_748070 [Cyathus striatus]